MKNTQLTWKEILVKQAWPGIAEVGRIHVMNLDGNSVKCLSKVQRTDPEQVQIDF